MNQIGLDKEESKDWPSLLPRVMFNMNTQRHSATKFSPFHLAFKRLPNLGNQIVEAENAEMSRLTDYRSCDTKKPTGHSISTTSSATSSNKSSIRKPPRRSLLSTNLSTSKDDPLIKCHLCESMMSLAAG